MKRLARSLSRIRGLSIQLHADAEEGACAIVFRERRASLWGELSGTGTLVRNGRAIGSAQSCLAHARLFQPSDRRGPQSDRVVLRFPHPDSKKPLDFQARKRAQLYAALLNCGHIPLRTLPWPS